MRPSSNDLEGGRRAANAALRTRRAQAKFNPRGLDEAQTPSPAANSVRPAVMQLQKLRQIRGLFQVLVRALRPAKVSSHRHGLPREAVLARCIPLAGSEPREPEMVLHHVSRKASRNSTGRSPRVRRAASIRNCLWHRPGLTRPGTMRRRDFPILNKPRSKGKLFFPISFEIFGRAGSEDHFRDTLIPPADLNRLVVLIIAAAAKKERGRAAFCAFSSTRTRFAPSASITQIDASSLSPQRWNAIFLMSGDQAA